MKKRNRFIAALLVLAMTCTLCIAHVQAETTWKPSQLEETYDVGETISIPTRVVNIDGTDVTAVAKVRLPDGTVTTETTLTLNQVGQYTVTYTASGNGKVVVEEETFSVCQDMFTLTSDASTATYEKYPHLSGISGLSVQLAYGDKITINQPIDMNKLDGGLLVQAFAVPSNVGSYDFEKLCFLLTDAENPEITLYMSARQYTNRPDLKTSYVTAGANGQAVIGYDDFADKFWNEGLFGRAIDHGFAFLINDVEINGINLRLNTETMELTANRRFVVDLDSTEYQTAPWSGFPSGKAYLTVWAETYSGTTASFFIGAAGDVDLSQDKVVDTEAPQITVSTPYDTMPSAVVGGSYGIPDATAWDGVSGECEVRVSAWYNYSSANPSILSIVDGRVETRYSGDYAIVYEATDSSGNVGREILWFKAGTELAKPTISLAEMPKSSYVLGEYFQAVDYTTQCSSGDPVVRIYTTVDGKTVELNEDYYFQNTGKYTVVYEVEDYAGQIGTYEYTIQVDQGDKPILVERIYLPDFLVEGSDYTFPTVQFHDYSSGKLVYKQATGTVEDAAGTVTLKAGDTYQVHAGSNLDTVKITFTCEGATYTVERPVVKAFDTDNGKTRLFLENYFVGDGFTCQREEDGVLFTTTAADAGWTFANRLLATDFNMTLQGVTGKTKFAGLNLVLKDSVDPTCSLTVELLNQNGVLCVRVGDNLVRMGEVSLAAGHTVSVTYRDDVLSVAGFKIDTGDFDGFPSKFVTVSLGFQDAAEGSAVRLISLNNHMLNNSNRDRVEAQIDILGSYGGRRLVGEDIVLPAAFAGDVLNPNITFTLTVKQGGKAVTALDGTLLENADPTKEYTIRPDTAERYTVIYTTEENFSEKTGGLSYILHIVDASAPELTFQQEVPTQAHLGDSVCIPAFTLTDNKTAAENLLVIKSVVGPSGVRMNIPANSNSITVSQVGVYKFQILVVDEDGYMHNETWSVTVTENQQ